MRLMLITLGSTGDVQPMIVLGRELKRRGHAVSLAAFEALRRLVEAGGLEFHSLPGDAERYIGELIRPGANPLTFLSRFEKALRSVANPLLDAVFQACHDQDAIVTTYFGSVVYAMADALATPLFQSNYCLTDLTGDYCLPVMKQPPLGRGFNRVTYRLAYRMMGILEARYFVPWCRENGIAPRRSSRGLQYHAAGKTVPVLYAMSEALVSRPAEWADNIHITGFWEESLPDYTPSESLSQFLMGDNQPIYIGFGSMTSGDMGEALSIVLQALRASGLRAVLSAGWSGMDAVSLPENVHILREFVPHRWLFEQVRGVVHHGGAGTTAAGLYAGRPSLIIPFGSDQFFWADRVYDAGCGPRPIPRSRLRADTLAAALSDLVENADYAEKACQLQQRLLAECGQANAADIIERTILQEYKQLCPDKTPSMP